MLEKTARRNIDIEVSTSEVVVVLRRELTDWMDTRARYKDITEHLIQSVPSILRL